MTAPAIATAMLRLPDCYETVTDQAWKLPGRGGLYQVSPVKVGPDSGGDPLDWPLSLGTRKKIRYQLPSFLLVHCFALAEPRLSVMHPTVTN